MFQSYGLFPHMTVADNVAHGLAARGVGRPARRQEAARMLDLVQLGHLGDRLPRALSGGQQQRVALARALAVQPAILLLDEPFAALDKNLRLDMQIEIKRIQRLAGTITILVTHDQEEALSMADRVAVLHAGGLEQFAAPTEVYDRPASLFVNGFVGQANRMAGTLQEAGTVRLDAGGTVSARAGALAPGSRVVVRLRPEHLRFDSDAQSGGIPATLELALPLGPTVVHEVRFGDGSTAKITEPREAGAAPRQPGAAVHVLAAPGPGILAGGFICFMASFDNIPVSLFLRDAATDMLPIRMWQDLEGKLDVTIAALSGVPIVATVAAMLLMERLAGLSRRLM